MSEVTVTLDPRAITALAQAAPYMPDVGVSKPALKLARILDRQPDGKYILVIEKTSAPLPWRLEILGRVDGEPGRVMELER